MIFEEKYFSHYVLLTDQISLPDCTYLLSNLWRQNFEINLSFPINPFYCITKKSGQKCKNLKNEKSL